MKYTETSIGRLFTLRLEHGDQIPLVIEEFARERDIKSAIVFFIGGAEKGSRVVVGPQDNDDGRIIPTITELSGTSEAVGIGTLFLNQEQIPKLHLHSAFGRNRETVTGCTREGVTIWHIGEVIIMEMVNNSGLRKIDPSTGFELLEV